jgi:hypothetical protein
MATTVLNDFVTTIEVDLGKTVSHIACVKARGAVVLRAPTSD